MKNVRGAIFGGFLALIIISVNSLTANMAVISRIIIVIITGAVFGALFSLGSKSPSNPLPANRRSNDPDRKIIDAKRRANDR